MFRLDVAWWEDWALTAGSRRVLTVQAHGCSSRSGPNAGVCHQYLPPHRELLGVCTVPKRAATGSCLQAAQLHA